MKAPINSCFHRSGGKDNEFWWGRVYC